MQEHLQRPDGTNIYICDGRLHREDGPALQTSDGTSYYFIDGVLHRDNGPAISSADPQHCHWYRHGVRVPSEDRSRSLIAELRCKHLGCQPADSGGSNGSNATGIRIPRKPKK
jgi:hypothetical protein